MIKNKLGFTLMEIMVVIIVIAVLASVAGPMIGSITDQGRSSATKSKLSTMKSALVSYKNDVGRFPYVGTNANLSLAKAYNEANTNYMNNQAHDGTTNDAGNVLVSNWVEPFSTNYQRRWKGPYMDANPEDFMVDGWGNRIEYFAKDYNIYVRSAGINGERDTTVEDTLDASKQEDGTADDVLMSIAKVRRKFN